MDPDVTGKEIKSYERNGGETVLEPSGIGDVSENGLHHEECDENVSEDSLRSLFSKQVQEGRKDEQDDIRPYKPILVQRENVDEQLHPMSLPARQQNQNEGEEQNLENEGEKHYKGELAYKPSRKQDESIDTDNGKRFDQESEEAVDRGG